MFRTVPIKTWLSDEAVGVLYAHTSEIGKTAETLEEHSDLVLYYAEMLMKENGVSTAVDRAINKTKIYGVSIDFATAELIRKYFVQAIYLHDLGKVNPAFQRKKMNNSAIGSRGGGMNDTTHSLLSSVLYLHIYLRELRQLEDESELHPSSDIPDRRMYSFLRHVLYTFAYVISRHHTYLGDMDALDSEYRVFEHEIRNKVTQIRNQPELVYYYRDKTSLLQEASVFDDIIAARRTRNNNSHSSYPFYIVAKLLYSTMVASDFRATYHYKEQKTLGINYFSERLPLQPMLDAFQDGDIYQVILKYKQHKGAIELTPINRLRTELFLETENRLQKRPDESIFYLEGPTGSGKTNMSINLALKLLQQNGSLNKIVYVFPFNALIEQTKQTLDQYFNKNELDGYKVEVINSITPMITPGELRAQENAPKGGVRLGVEPDQDFKSVLLQRQLLQYPVTLTSHVNLFNYLFGAGREANLAFAHLCNSVIILDEIQSYRNGLWKEIIHFLRAFADIMNIKFIIMSATLPKLDLLLEQSQEEENVETYPLVLNRETYFAHPVFRKRVNLHFEWLQEQQMSLEKLGFHLSEIIAERRAHGRGNRILIEFIKKKSAREFYNMIRNQHSDIPLFELTGDDSPYYRKIRLDQLGKDKKTKHFLLNEVIVVATQVIEAGVDIDMDVGLKDISLLDSEEQFLGRINRSCDRDDCHAYFFDMDKASGIYRNDWRTEHDLHHEDYQSMLLNKDFSAFYELSMQRINESRQVKGKNHWFLFESMVQSLDFKGVQQHMDLIPDKSVTLFLNYTLEMLDGTLIVGEEVWNEFVDLVDKKKRMDYAEWKIRLSSLREQMSYFTFTYPLNRNKEIPAIYSEAIGSLYYVPNGTDYMDYEPDTRAWKFDRAKYMEAERGPLL